MGEITNKEFLKFIKLIKQQNKDLTYDEVIYLLGLKEKIVIDLPSGNLARLHTNGYINVNKPSDKFIIEKKKSNVNPSFPILTEKTGFICKDLAALFLHNLDSNEIEKIKNYSSNVINIPFIYIFFQMFPTADEEKNKVWEKVFKAKWDNVTLRKMTFGSVKKIEAIWNNYDIGLFLLGTYTFIISSYNGSKDAYFIKNVNNFFKEWQFWYDEASTLNKGSMTISKKNNKNDKNTTML